MRLRTVVAHTLTDLVSRQALDQGWTHEQRDGERRDHGENRPQREVTEDIEPGLITRQVFGQKQQHSRPSSAGPCSRSNGSERFDDAFESIHA